ncbi:MAG: hypothetical protein KUG57_07420 [Ilumatobacteraceae bacterium]|nr:hypothetical protein [Ilumatobacteraceae bacterium]
MQPETTTIRGRLRRVVTVARRELRSPPPATWKLVDRRGENERFSNRVVLVTGAAGLIGYQLVQAFINSGAIVHAVDINGDGLDRRATSGGELAGGAVPVDAIGHAVRFLCDSRVSRMTTGQHLAIDGGAGMYRSGVHNQPLEQW